MLDRELYISITLSNLWRTTISAKDDKLSTKRYDDLMLFIVLFFARMMFHRMNYTYKFFEIFSSIQFISFQTPNTADISFDIAASKYSDQ